MRRLLYAALFAVPLAWAAVDLVHHNPPPSGACTGLCVGLVHVWDLDESSGTRADAIGSADLTDNNTVTGCADSMHNGASDFEASNQEELTYSAGIGRTGATSISFWHRFESDIAYVTPVGESAAADLGWYFEIRSVSTNPGHIEFYKSSDGSTSDGRGRENNPGLTLDTWYHFVWRFDAAGNCNWYRNGSLILSDTSCGTAINDPSAFWGVGGTNMGGFKETDGCIDEVYVYSRYLSTTDISDLYNSGSGRFYGTDF